MRQNIIVEGKRKVFKTLSPGDKEFDGEGAVLLGLVCGGNWPEIGGVKLCFGVTHDEAK